MVRVCFADNLGLHIVHRFDGSSAVALEGRPKMVDLDTKLLDGYAGTYEFSPGSVVNVTRDGRWLETQTTEDDEKVGIFPESATKFFFKFAHAEVTFETDTQGRASGMIVHQDGLDHEAKRVQYLRWCFIGMEILQERSVYATSRRDQTGGFRG